MPVLFHADHRFFQPQLVIVRVRDRHRKGERTNIVCFQCQLRVKDKGSLLVVRIIQNVPFGPVVALSVRSALDLPDIHNVAGGSDALHFAAPHGGRPPVVYFHSQGVEFILFKMLHFFLRHGEAVYAILNCGKGLAHRIVNFLCHGDSIAFRVGYLVRKTELRPSAVDAVFAKVVTLDIRRFIAGSKAVVVHRSVFIHAEAYKDVATCRHLKLGFYI